MKRLPFHVMSGAVGSMLLVFAACGSKVSKDGATDNAVPSAAVPHAAVSPSAVSPLAITPAVAVAAATPSAPNVALTAPAFIEKTTPITGTPLSVTLPKDVKRASRGLTFRSAGADPITVQLTLAHGVTDARALVLGASRTYGVTGWFSDATEPKPLARKGEGFFATGKMTFDATGLHKRASSGLLVARVEKEWLVSGVISFPPAQAAKARAIAESIRLDASLPTDSLTAFGAALKVPTGYHRNPQMFEPLFYYPDGATPSGPAGPSLELRFRTTEDLENTFTSLIPAFSKDPKSAKCVDPALTRHDHLSGKDCTVVADSMGDAFRVRLYGMTDAIGSVIGIVRTPLFGAEVHEDAFNSILQSITLSPVAAE